LNHLVNLILAPWCEIFSNQSAKPLFLADARATVSVPRLLIRQRTEKWHPAPCAGFVLGRHHLKGKRFSKSLIQTSQQLYLLQKRCQHHG
jgi:hypothetical protein